MILLDFVPKGYIDIVGDSCDFLNEGESWTLLWGFICCLHFKSLAAFCILRIKTLMYQLFFSRISSSSFTWVLALYIACCCTINRLKLWFSYVEWWFGVLISAPLLRGTYWPCELRSLTWCRWEIKQACLDPPWRSPVLFVSKKPKTDELSVAASWQSSSIFQQPGGSSEIYLWWSDTIIFHKPTFPRCLRGS